MVPVVRALKAESWADVRILVTAQHRELLDQVLERFAIVPDVDLNIMRHNQSLPTLTARLIEKVAGVLEQEHPVLVLSQGDTTTVFAVALACFYQRIDFGHVEAGLRTFDRNNPFPEEMNREMAGRLARFNFCPTMTAAENLKREGIAGDAIHITGNTVIDTLRQVSGEVEFHHGALDSRKRLVLVTAHRRENFGKPFANICEAVNRITDEHQDVQVLYPVHPNPNVRLAAYRALGGNPAVILCEPLDYFDFVGAMKRAYLILTDSGGVQEEAPALGKPVLVLREKTERPEAVAEGVVRVIGTGTEEIVTMTRRLLGDKSEYERMARGVSPYGDGFAAVRIATILRGHYGSGE
jgi:UDP-N-acetylglucosamine 2-epimerase (non-hydrolysing)